MASSRMAMVPWPSLLLALLAAVAPTGAVRPSKIRVAHELRSEYEASAKRCRHGHRGVVIKLHDDSISPKEYFDLLRARAVEGDVMRHHFNVTLRAVAANLSPASLDKVFDDPHTISVAADCVYYMHHIERTLLHPRPRGSAELGVSTQDVDSMGVDRMITSGVEVRSGSFGEFWNWGLDRIDQTLGTNNRYSFGNSTGRGTVLYTIDTGIYVHHSDFAGRIVDGYSIGCPTGNEEACRTGQWVHKGYITDDTPTASGFQSDTGERCDSHGTHTASTAAGRLYGVAKEAEIVVVQGLDCNGTASNSMFIAALDWAVGDARRRGKPAVMSMSLGGDRDDLLDQAAQRASAHGFTVVTASGNDGGDSCAMSPGGAKEAISVAAIDQTDTIAPYSNRGACTNLIAPGTGIVAAYIGGSKDSAAALSGTSMATPHVAGAVLQLLQHYPHYTPLDISRALTCMSTKGVVKGLDAQTPNHLLHTGTMLAEAQNAQLLGQIQGASGRDVTAQQMGCLDDPSSGGSQQAHGALQPAPLH